MPKSPYIVPWWDEPRLTCASSAGSAAGMPKSTDWRRRRAAAAN
jgi:hypothetical protein